MARSKGVVDIFKNVELIKPEKGARDVVAMRRKHFLRNLQAQINMIDNPAMSGHMKWWYHEGHRVVGCLKFANKAIVVDGDNTHFVADDMEALKELFEEVQQQAERGEFDELLTAHAATIQRKKKAA
jgi:hypothetical protein